MKPIIVLSQALVQNLQQQVVHLLHTELSLFDQFDFSEEELVAAGWSVDLVDRLQTVLAQMRAKLSAKGLAEKE